MVIHQEIWRRLPALLGISDSVIRQEVLVKYLKDVHLTGYVLGQNIADFEGSELSKENFQTVLRRYMGSPRYGVKPQIDLETWEKQIDGAHKKIGLDRSLLYSGFLGDPYHELLADMAVVFYFRNFEAMSASSVFEPGSLESLSRSFAPGQKPSTWRSNRNHGLFRPVRSMIGERYWLDSGLSPQKIIPAIFDAVWDEMRDPNPAYKNIGTYQGFWRKPDAKKVRAMNESLIERIEDTMNRVQ